MNEAEFRTNLKSFIKREIMQTEEKIVYKVVHYDRNNNRYYSANESSTHLQKEDEEKGHIVEYKIRKTSFPPGRLGPLMAFETVEAARDFAKYITSLRIFKCTAEVSDEQIRRVAMFTHYSSIREYWDGYYNSGYYHRNSVDCWEGTIFCHSITLIEEIPRIW